MIHIRSSASKLVVVLALTLAQGAEARCMKGPTWDGPCGTRPTPTSGLAWLCYYNFFLPVVPGAFYARVCGAFSPR